ncbi:hypothetical protein [Methylosinus sp. PW1]|uniref:hypothetical protein n=1 Tax=Methylosinus sp. PW1 TaxID=107636 RepID=UPI00056D7A22|nr:hypothetical protein [Methylosinus sp. PW1]
MVNIITFDGFLDSDSDILKPRWLLTSWLLLVEAITAIQLTGTALVPSACVKLPGALPVEGRVEMPVAARKLNRGSPPDLNGIVEEAPDGGLADG